MPRHSRLRSALCLWLILIVHLVIVITLMHQHRELPAPELVQSTLLLIPERNKHDLTAEEKVAPKAAFARPRAMTNLEKPSILSLGKTDPTPESTPQTMLSLDLDTLHDEAVRQELARERSPMEMQNEVNKKNGSVEAHVEDGTNKAQRADCRTAHSGAGLFAPLMIAADLLRDKGCKL